jgi:hypothetical protein
MLCSLLVQVSCMHQLPWLMAAIRSAVTLASTKKHLLTVSLNLDQLLLLLLLQMLDRTINTGQ